MDTIKRQILDLAQADDRIRWVILTGSKANPMTEPDPYQDFDVQLGVFDLESFTSSDEWLECFGERAIMQKPEAMSLFEPSLGGRFTYLMQFVDGSRLDLMLVPLDKSYPLDIHSEIWLDKDQRIDMRTAEEIVYWNTSENVVDCMNEFLWLSFYVVKGYKRNQMIYAQDHLNTMREMVLQMAAWKMGGNPGLSYKYLEPKLSASFRKQLIKTYHCEDILTAMAILFDLMKEAARDYEYNRKEFGLVWSMHQESMV